MVKIEDSGPGWEFKAGGGGAWSKLEAGSELSPSDKLRVSSSAAAEQGSSEDPSKEQPPWAEIQVEAENAQGEFWSVSDDGAGKVVQ